jgi:hypothetical protein
MQSEAETSVETSDGCHTFDELYYHRAVLFAALCRTHRSRVWRAKLHNDGTMDEGYFIAGISTPEGHFTYHCRLEHWNLFDSVRELERAPIWDGHTSEDVTRLLSLNRNDTMRTEAEVAARLEEYRAVYRGYLRDLKDIRADPELSERQKKKERNIILNLQKSLKPKIEALAWVMGEEEEEEGKGE